MRPKNVRQGKAAAHLLTERFRLDVSTMRILGNNESPSKRPRPSTEGKQARVDDPIISVVYTTNPFSVEKWVAEHMKSKVDDRIYPHLLIPHVPFGFDCEWKPNTSAAEHNPPALIQICPDANNVLLFQVKGKKNRDEGLPEFELETIEEDGPLAGFYDVLTSQRYVRIGASIKTDLAMMRDFHDIRIPSSIPMLELTDVARQHYLLHLCKKLPIEFIRTLEENRAIMGSVKHQDRLTRELKFPVLEFVDCLVDTAVTFDQQAIQVYIDAIQTIEMKNFRFKDDIIPAAYDEMQSWDRGKPLLVPHLPSVIKCGLGSLSERYLNIEVRKSNRLSCSNWEAYPLYDEQLIYAALDGWISQTVFLHIMKDILNEFKHLDDTNLRVVLCDMFPFIKV